MNEYITGPKKWPPEAQRRIFWNISCPGSIKSLQVHAKYNVQLSLESLWVHHFAHRCHQSICPPYVFCFRLLHEAELPRIFLLSSVLFLIWPPPPFSFLSGLWTSSTLGSCFHLQLCFGQGKKLCQWKGTGRKQGGFPSAVPGLGSGGPRWDLSVPWGVDWEGICCCWRPTGSDQRWSKR